MSIDDRMDGHRPPPTRDGTPLAKRAGTFCTPKTDDAIVNATTLTLLNYLHLSGNRQFHVLLIWIFLLNANTSMIASLEL